MFLTEPIGQSHALGNVSWANSYTRVKNALNKKAYDRTLGLAMLVGGGAARDAGMKYWANQRELGKLYNQVLEAADMDIQAYGMNYNGFIPMGAPCSLEVIDALTANDYYLYLQIIENMYGAPQNKHNGTSGKRFAGMYYLDENIGTMTGTVASQESGGMEKTKKLEDHIVNETNDRWISHAVIKGGSARYDSQAAITVDGVIKSTLMNSITTPTVQGDKYMLPVSVFVPKGESIDVICLETFDDEINFAAKIWTLA
jgi:hypothetical protein